MWTCCRAFRLTEAITGTDVVLTNGGVSFDWETGDESATDAAIAKAAHTVELKLARFKRLTRP